MTTYSPGPWDNGLHHAVWNGGRRYAYIRSQGNLVPIAAVVLGVEGYGHEEGEANARLIAAATVMLEALHIAESRLCEVVAINGGELNSEALAEVRQAIAKAEGRNNG